MASVMALSSVAVVANAEDAQYKSKAELEKLVYETYGDTFRTDELSEYGSVSADAVLDALEAAEAILNDDEKDEADYTVAYMMVEATVSRLVIYTAEELDALIKKCTSIYESNNIYNEELQDRIYTVKTYGALTEAYENATLFVTSSSSVDITEAYEQLNKAYNELEKETVVSKSMFRSVMKQYEAIIKSEYAYETWRRGAYTSDWTNLNTGNYWAIQGAQATFGVAWESMLSVKADINSAYESIDSIKTLSKTSDEDIVAGYKMAQDAVTLFNAWSADDTSRATKAGVNALLKQYHGCLVYEYNMTSAEALYDLIDAANGVDEKTGENKLVSDGVAPTYGQADYWQPSWSNNTTAKLTDAKWNIKSTVNIYVPVDAKGFWTGADIKVGTRPDESTLPTGAERWQLISAKTNFDILKMIKVDSSMISADLDNKSGGKDISGDSKNAVLDRAYEWNTFGAPIIYGEMATHDENGNAFQVCDWSTGADVHKDGEKSRIAYYLEGGTTHPHFWEADMSDDYNTNIDFSNAYLLAENYIAGNHKAVVEGAGNDIYDVDTTGVVAKEASGNSKEWAMVYRYLKYALEDKYSAVVTTETHTRADVKKLIDDCYDLADLTGDAAIFEVTHNAMVEARQDALDWLTEATADKLYKDNTTFHVFGNYTVELDKDGDGTPETYSVAYNSTGAYDHLYAKYEALLKEYNAMKYSFGDIYDKLAEVTAMIDDGDLEATTELLTALDETAYRLSVVDDLVNETYDENPAFDVDRAFQAHNRLITNTGDAQNIATINQGVTTKDGANPTHAALATAYDALLAAVDAQLAPAALLGDVDGNGTVNALDASALLVNTVNGVTMDAAVADYDKNGSINALDASAILIAIVNGTV